MTQFSISKDKKHILAGYVNLARFNFWRTWLHILNAIEVKIDGKNNMFDESRINNAVEALFFRLSAQKMPERLNNYAFKLNESKKLRLRELLFRHFPMIEPVLANNIQKNNKQSSDKKNVSTLADCVEIINDFGKCLNDIRNYYTHYDPYNEKIAEEYQRKNRFRIAKHLDIIILAASRAYKLRGNLSEDEMKFFTGEKRNKRVGKKYVERDDWRFRLIKKVGMMTDESGKTIDKKDITDFGIVWFCSLFLPKKYAVKLFNEYDLLKPDGRLTSHDMEIFREMLCFFRIVIPHGPKLDSTVTEMALALDMLNELRKCPRPLFDTLRPSAQKDFEIDARGDIKSESVSSDELSSFNIRHSDRFPYFVLRYFDEMNILPKIRFQIRLGKFRFKFYEKTLIDQSPEDDKSLRILQKDLNGFGRLNDIEKARKEKYADFLQDTTVRTFEQEDGQIVELEQFISDSPDSKPYVTNSRASYLIDNNRIGLYWDDENDNPRRLSGPDRLFIPDLGDLTERPELLSPKAFLSVRDLQAMVFYHHLQSKSRSGDRVEDIIIKKHGGIRRMLDDVANGNLSPIGKRKEVAAYVKEHYGLSIADVPDKIIDFLARRSTPSADIRKKDYALRQLTARLQKAQRMLDSIKEKTKKIEGTDNKFGKKGYEDIRPGRLAGYMMRSIVDWQPTSDDGKNKLTGANYRALQSYLALYGQNEQSSKLCNVLKKAGLLDGPTAHPFLMSVIGCGSHNVVELYNNYLIKEIEHIKKFVLISDDNFSLHQNVDLTKLPFVGTDKMRFTSFMSSEAYRELAKRYLKCGNGSKDKAVLLPDGLFTDAIIDQLKSTNSFKALFEEAKAVSDQERLKILSRNRNVSFLLTKYLSDVMNDKSQNYYAESQYVQEENNKYARSYWLFDMLKDDIDRSFIAAQSADISSSRTNKNEEQKHIYLLPYKISAILSEKSGEKIGKNGRQERDKQGNHMWNRKIDDIISLVANRENSAKHKNSGIKNGLNDLEARMHKAVSEVKKNEREIRRYKIQDISVFLMVKDLLSDQKAIVDSDFFRLCNVTFPDLLDTTVTFRYPFHIKDRTIEIVQENMSIKNYPEFRRLLADDRVKTIVEQSKTDEIRFDDLTSELANYDANRSEVFKIIHQLERLLRESGKIDLDNQSSAEFYYTDFDGKIKPLRNNFYRMLEYINDLGLKSLDEEQKKLIIDIRNAFSHNNYIKNIERVPDATDLPNIAREILKRLNEISQ